MRFEWDPAKEASNEAKHQISFDDAIEVFDDSRHLVEDSTKPEHGEIRMKAIGMADGVMMAVIYTDRQDGRRIISARKVRRDERERYDRGGETA